MRHCQYCGAELPLEVARFCGNCGQPVSTPAPAEAPKTPPANNSRPLADAPTVRGTPPQANPTPHPEAAEASAGDFSFQEFQAPIQETPGTPAAPARVDYPAGEQFGASVVEPQPPARPVPPTSFAAPAQNSGGYPVIPQAPQTPQSAPQSVASASGAYLPPAGAPPAAGYPQATPPQPGSYPPPMTSNGTGALPQSGSSQPGSYPSVATSNQSGIFPQAVPAQPGYPPQPQGSPPPYGGYPPAGSYMPPQRKAWLSTTAGKVTLAILILVVVLGGVGSFAIYQMTRPKPVISVASDYKVDNIPAGANTTSLHVKGEQFSTNSAITFLLDNKPLPAQSVAVSDKDGKLDSTLKIDENWSVGKHTLTAKDAGGYTTQTGVTITIVTQGQANTPGPKGAPADDESFNLEVILTGRDSESGSPYTAKLTLIVTGHADPTGGSICTRYADGTPHTNTNTSGGTTVKETATTQCQGTYKGGKVNYNEKLLQDSLEITSQGKTYKCTLDTADQFHLEGNFDSKDTASGSFDSGTQSYNCDIPGSSTLNAHDTGTWTGYKS